MSVIFYLYLVAIKRYTLLMVWKQNLLRLTVVLTVFWTANSSVYGQLSSIRRYQHTGGQTAETTFDPEGNFYLISLHYLSSTRQGKGFLISKYNAQDSLIWTKTYRSNQYPISYVRPYFLNGRLYLLGNMYEANGGCQENAFVVAFTPEGQVIQATTLRLDNHYMGAPTGLTSDHKGNIYFADMAVFPRCSGTYNGYITSLDSNLQIRFAIKTMERIYSYSMVSVWGNSMQLGHSLTSTVYGLDGRLKKALKQNSSQSSMYHSYSTANQNGYYQIWTHRKSNKYGFQIIKRGEDGEITAKSTAYMGYASTFEFDPKGHIHLLVPPNSTDNPKINRYAEFDQDLNLLDVRQIQHDSLDIYGHLSPRCSDQIKIFSMQAPSYAIQDFKISKDYSGPGIRFEPSFLESFETTLSQSDTTLLDIPVSWTQSPYDLRYVTDTTLSADLYYQYPICTPKDWLPTDTIICSDQALQLPGLSIQPQQTCGTPQNRYLWSTRSTETSATISQSGLYRCTLKHGGCVYEDSIRVIFDSAYKPLSPEYQHCFDEQGDFIIPIDSTLAKQWTSLSSDPLTREKPGHYILDGTSILGCPLHFETTVSNHCGYMIYVPTAFTPDGDGINDIFGPQGAGLDQWCMEIFDRWGRTVVILDSKNPTWDGSFPGGELANGLYAYLLHYRDMDSGTKKSMHGRITVLR